MDKFKREKLLYPYFNYISRPLARMILKTIKVKINPNIISVIAISFVIVGFLYLFSGKIWYCFFLLFLYTIFDCLDGEIARKFSASSKKGELIDAIGGYIFQSYFFIGLTWYITNNHDYIRFHDLPSRMFVVLLISSILPLLIRILNLRYSVIFQRNLKDPENLNMVMILASWFENFILIVFLIAIILKSIDIFLYLYLIFYYLKLTYFIYAIIKS